jgi:hypothetical protein
LRRDAATEDESGLDQLVERRVQFPIAAPGDGSEQFVGKIPADNGTDLRHLLDRREAIEPGH